MNPTIRGQFSVFAARFLLTLALLALVGAWITQLTDSPLWGMSQQHLFHDATVLALLGIGMMLDALYHSKGL